MPPSNDEFDFDDGDDDLFDYDVDEAIRTVDTFVPEPKIITSATADREGADINRGDDRDAGGLGVDEEVKVRKRKVNVKLDEQRYENHHCSLIRHITPLSLFLQSANQ